MTYRLYDYDRKDKDGNLRDLHLEKSKEAIKIINDENKVEDFTKPGLKGRILTKNEYFEVVEKNIDGSCDFTNENPYLLQCVAEGKGEIIIDDSSYLIKKGDFFILTNYCKTYKVKGDVSLVEAVSLEE